MKTPPAVLSAQESRRDSEGIGRTQQEQGRKGDPQANGGYRPDQDGRSQRQEPGGRPSGSWKGRPAAWEWRRKMPKQGKTYRNAKDKIETPGIFGRRGRNAAQGDPAPQVRRVGRRFDAPVGVDPKYPDQMVRGTLVLPSAPAGSRGSWSSPPEKSRRKPPKPERISSAATRSSRRSRRRTGLTTMWSSPRPI